MNTELTHDDHFRIAVVQAAATMERPEYGDRLQQAMDLVLAGNVMQNADGTATVKSGSHTYQIDPQAGCTCADSQNRSRYCKHAIAVELLRCTQLRLGSQPNGAQPPPPAVPPQSAAWQVHEAPASCCLKFTLSGMEVLYTMRDVNDELLFARVRHILPKVQEKVMTQAEASNREPDGQRCAIHNAPMKRHSKGTQSWYSHQAPDGSWCRGS
jgi:hypothetical protein